MSTRLINQNGVSVSRRIAGTAALHLLAAASLLQSAACTGGPGKSAPPPIILATTTSTYDSGLLDDIIPPFEKASGMTVKTIVVGSGKALALGERGEADLLLVHAPEAEEGFMARGGGILRRRMMYNDFVLVGPAADPAGVGGAADLKAAMTALHRSGAVFVSRGDGSGTQEMELDLWKQAGLSHPAEGYLETGQGMASTLRVASEKRGYTLTDRFGRERFGQALFVPDAEPFEAAASIAPGAADPLAAPGGPDAPHR